MIQKLINPSKQDDVLFLAGVVLNILNESSSGEKESEILPELFTTLGMEGTLNLIKYFGGEKITIPSQEQTYNSFLILVCYYKRKLENKSWEGIRDELGIDLSPHALGKVIKALDDRITVEMEELKEMGIEDLMTSLKKGKPDGK